MQSDGPGILIVRDGVPGYRRCRSDRSFDDGTREIIGAAIDVHREPGPGLLESVYEACLCRELSRRGLSFERQIALPIAYKGEKLDAGLRIDLLVDDRVVIELKSVEKLGPVHEAQLLTYLKLTGKQIGLLLNFNVRRMTDGVKRMVLGVKD